MMKAFKRVITFMFVVMLLVSVSGNVVMAANGSDTYTVTFYAGEEGKFVSTEGLDVNNRDAVIDQTEEKIAISGLKEGDIVAFHAPAAVAIDAGSEHYVQGIRVNESDNDTIAAPVFNVTGDAEYAVVYGVKENLTSYIVNYQDADGNALAVSDMYCGNIGDKPVVAYQCQEGYTVQVLGYEKTLNDNVSDNVFTFVYDKAGEQEVILDQTQIVDLDEEETPLANVQLRERGDTGLLLAGVTALIILAIIAFVHFIISYRSNKMLQAMYPLEKERK